MKEYFNGFSTQDYIDMRRADDERNEKKRLEEEIKKLNKICARKSHYIDKKDLEIERLNKEIEYLKEGKPIFKSIGLQDYENIQRRINKAIKYIEQKDKWYKNEEYKLLKTSDLLNILEGKDSE